MNTDKKNIKNNFPFFGAKKNANLIYFDNAATTHKPENVISAISSFYRENNSNIHRSTHIRGASATKEYESARNCIAEFISARSSSEIIFTSGATEGVNLVASSFGRANIKKGDTILVSEIEHHSNMLPWMTVAQDLGAEIQKIPLDNKLMVDLKKFEQILNNRVKMVAIHHVSNVTGIMQDIKSIVDLAHTFNVPVFVDGAQAPAHTNIDVAQLNCDFYCFSSHKLFGPTGVGVLFVKNKHLQQLSPYKTGGQMVSVVGVNGPTWAEAPLKFEAGTPNISGVVGLNAAIQFMQTCNLNKLIKLEKDLILYMSNRLNEIPQLVQYGLEGKSVPIFAFNVKGVHHYDISSLLAQNNILVRAGHLCNQGFMNYFNIEGCVRASLSIYNTSEEIDKFISVLKKIISFLR